VNLAGNLIRSHVTILGVRTYLMTLKIRPCVTYLSSLHHCHKHSTEFREKHSSFSTHNWYTVYHMTAWVSTLYNYYKCLYIAYGYYIRRRAM